MNEYIKNRMELDNLAVKQNCKGADLDEKYSGGLWDWAGEIIKPIQHEGYEHLADEIQCEIYYALSEVYDTLKGGK